LLTASRWFLCFACCSTVKTDAAKRRLTFNGLRSEIYWKIELFKNVCRPSGGVLCLHFWGK
jgi:hypothetical protein